MKLELTVEELHELQSGVATVRAVSSYPALIWDYDKADQRVIVGSCDSCDGSLPLYEVSAVNGEWKAIALCDSRRALAYSINPVACFDACREHFMDSVDADRNVADAARQVS